MGGSVRERVPHRERPPQVSLAVPGADKTRGWKAIFVVEEKDAV